MKPSRFNHFISRPDGRFLAFNARSGGLAIMEADKYRLYQKLAEMEGPVSPSDVETIDLMKDLRRGRFLIDDGEDELEQLELVNQMARFDSRSLSLTIAPTMDCNLDCRYCFEERNRDSMTADVADKVVEFVRKRVDTLALVRVCWYGGEPLFAAGRLFDLSRRIRAVCDDGNCRYTATMISNGYLLDRAMAERLKEQQVTDVQLTLDGPREVHDARRPLADGSGSWDVILDNIGQVVGLLRVNVRINVDQKNTDRVAELLETLEHRGLRDKLAVYFGKLEASTSVCQNIAEDCLDNRAFSLAEIELFQQALGRGFAIGKLPRPSPAFCGAVKTSSFLVDPRGRLYKCWNEVGTPERSLGPIDQKIDILHPELYPWLTSSPFKKKQCRRCNILPLCMGGCPMGEQGNGQTSTDNCTTWKYNLDQMLELIAQSRMRMIRERKEKQAVP